MFLKEELLLMFAYFSGCGLKTQVVCVIHHRCSRY